MPHNTAPYTIDPAEFPGSFANYTPARESLEKFAEIQRGAFKTAKPVSYTHLTLPTNREV